MYGVRGYETAKVAKRVAKYCKGQGLDLGCGNILVSPNAIGVDFEKSADVATVILDLSKPHALKMFADKSMDFVFSSHFLEDLKDTKGTLREWCRVIKPGGYLVLYVPDKSIYPHVGQPGASPYHKVNLGIDDIGIILYEIGGFKVISAKIRNNYERFIINEYSFELVAKKLP